MVEKEIFRIPKKSVPVNLLLAQKQTLECSVYLAEVSSTHAGTQTVDEFLNRDDRRFIPVHVLATDRDILISKQLIITLETPSEEVGKEFKESVPPVSVSNVTVELLNGDTLEGVIRIYGAENLSRVSDFLNDERYFLPIHASDRIIFINRDFIRRVEDRDEVKEVAE